MQFLSEKRSKYSLIELVNKSSNELKIISVLFKSCSAVASTFFALSLPVESVLLEAIKRQFYFLRTLFIDVPILITFFLELSLIYLVSFIFFLHHVALFLRSALLSFSSSSDSFQIPETALCWTFLPSRKNSASAAFSSSFISLFYSPYVFFSLIRSSSTWWTSVRSSATPDPVDFVQSAVRLQYFSALNSSQRVLTVVFDWRHHVPIEMYCRNVSRTFLNSLLRWPCTLIWAPCSRINCKRKIWFHREKWASASIKHFRRTEALKAHYPVRVWRAQRLKEKVQVKLVGKAKILQLKRRRRPSPATDTPAVLQVVGVKGAVLWVVVAVHAII